MMTNISSRRDGGELEVGEVDEGKNYRRTSRGIKGWLGRRWKGRGKRHGEG